MTSLNAPRNTILFSTAKKELFSPSSGLKQLQRRLRATWKVGTVKDNLSAAALSEAALVVFAGPREKFSAAEFSGLKEYMEDGGSLLFMLGEWGESRFDTNINFLLEEFGVVINNVGRQVPTTHPA